MQWRSGVQDWVRGFSDVTCVTARSIPILKRSDVISWRRPTRPFAYHFLHQKFEILFERWVILTSCHMWAQPNHLWLTSPQIHPINKSPLVHIYHRRHEKLLDQKSHSCWHFAVWICGLVVIKCEHPVGMQRSAGLPLRAAFSLFLFVLRDVPTLSIFFSFRSSWHTPCYTSHSFPFTDVYYR